jgi:hypothetical protein
MAFITVTPRKLMCLPMGTVKISFCKTRYKPTVIIRIPKDLCDKVGMLNGDRVHFSYDEDDKRIWLIKKTKELMSYKISVNKSSGKRFLGIQLTWDNTLFEPDESEYKIHYVNANIEQGGIRIDSRPITLIQV